MGDGLRSLFYISLVDSILDVEGQMVREIEIDPEHTSFNRKPPILTIVAIEEPENHIAPHLLGKLVGNLKDIAGKNNAQAIMTSHSPAIVKRIDPENLRYFRLDRELLASKVKASVTFTFCKKRTGMKCPMQRHNAINEFFDLLQRPGIAEVKRFQNR